MKGILTACFRYYNPDAFIEALGKYITQSKNHNHRLHLVIENIFMKSALYLLSYEKMHSVFFKARKIIGPQLTESMKRVLIIAIQRMIKTRYYKNMKRLIVYRGGKEWKDTVQAEELLSTLFEMSPVALDARIRNHFPKPISRNVNKDYLRDINPNEVH